MASKKEARTAGLPHCSDCDPAAAGKPADVRRQGSIPTQLIGFPPKLYVIGAQKCGTTALCEVLEQTLPVKLSQPKETAFFTRNFSRGQKWYRACFTKTDQILLDGTPAYTMGYVARTHFDSPRNRAAQRIHDLVPEAHLIYIVRDPVLRTWAGYWHAVRAGRERKSITETISTESPYVRGSMYWRQLADYLALFPRRQVLCVDQTYFFEAPNRVVQGIASWLDVPVFEEVGDSPRRVNQTYKYNASGRMLHVILPTPVRKSATQLVKCVLPSKVVRQLRAGVTTSIPELDAETWRRVADLVGPDYETFRRECADRFLDGRLPSGLGKPDA